MDVGVWHQREEACALDRNRQLTLIACFGAGDSRRDDLAIFVDEIFQELDILLVDFLDSFSGETTELAALEQRPEIAIVLLLVVLRSTSASECHDSFLLLDVEFVHVQHRASTAFAAVCQKSLDPYDLTQPNFVQFQCHVTDGDRVDLQADLPGYPSLGLP